jgi:hypothetical protein
MHPILAYIDGSTLSMVLSVVVASILAIPYFLRTQISRATKALRGERKDDTDQRG